MFEFFKREGEKGGFVRLEFEKKKKKTKKQRSSWYMSYGIMFESSMKQRIEKKKKPRTKLK